MCHTVGSRWKFNAGCVKSEAITQLCSLIDAAGRFTGGTGQAMASERIRLDQALVARGLAATRARARDLILRGAVRIGDAVADKPARMVDMGLPIEVAAEANAHVARSAAKLIAALETFQFDPAGRVALDVGASTGGFTEVLLARGVVKVHAVDVGHGQLHASIAADPRVVDLSGTDARGLGRAVIADPVGCITADVSFIALAKALPAALALAAPGCWLAALVKPQFELGPAAIGKGGIVKDPADGPRALEANVRWLAGLPGWRVVGTCVSPLAGKGGNIEYLIGALHDG